MSVKSPHLMTQRLDTSIWTTFFSLALKGRRPWSSSCPTTLHVNGLCTFGIAWQHTTIICTLTRQDAKSYFWCLNSISLPTSPDVKQHIHSIQWPGLGEWMGKHLNMGGQTKTALQLVHEKWVQGLAEIPWMTILGIGTGRRS